MAKPRPSEWGKLSAGQPYIFWAMDFARAVFSLGLGENVAILFWYVIENSWGTIRDKRRGEWPDPVPVEVVPSELAEAWGMTKQRVYDAQQWLLKARMVVRTDRGFWVNKNADEWVHPVSEAPLLAGRRLAYAMAGRGRHDDSYKQPTSNVLTLPIGENESDRVTLERDESNGLTLPESRSNVTRRVEERAREEEFPEKELPAPGAALRPPADPPVSHGDCIELVRRLWGDAKAERVRGAGDDIARTLQGRFDCYAAAVREIERRRVRKPGKNVGNFHALALMIAGDYVRGKPFDDPVGLDAAPPAEPTPEERDRKNAELARKLQERVAKEGLVCPKW